MTNHDFPKQARLLHGRDFDRVFSARMSAADELIVVYGAENELGRARLGLAVSRRFGPAVARNRWKRLVREAFRTSQQQLPPLDLICVPRGSESPDAARFASSLKLLASRIEEKLHQRRQRELPGGAVGRSAR